MSQHVHTWLRDTARNRFACECGALGHAPSIMGGQHRGAKTKVIAYRCRLVVDGQACGAEAVHVEGDKQNNRCVAHR